MSATTLACSQTAQLTLKPSALFTLYILLCHGLAVAGLWYSAIGLLLWSLLTVVLVAHGLWRALLYWRQPPQLLSWGEGGWHLNGQPVSLLANHSYYPWLLHLRFQYLAIESEAGPEQVVSESNFYWPQKLLWLRGLSPWRAARYQRLILLPDSVTGAQVDALSRLRFWLLNREVGGATGGPESPRLRLSRRGRRSHNN